MIFKTQGFSNLVWGLLLLLAAVFIIANQVGGFVEVGLWSILVAALAVAYSLACILKLKIASLPIPLAILYIVAQTPFELPFINPWLLILASVIASIGLHILLPKRIRKSTKFGGATHRSGVKIGDDIEISEDGIKIGDIEIDDDFEIDNKDYDEYHEEVDDYDNNPSASVSFGAQSRYLHADALESAHLSCSFGSLEVYFDQAKLSPKGATVYCDCKFGAIEIYVPKEWCVLDDLSATLGGTEVNRRRAVQSADAPVLRVKGNVAFGAIEVTQI